MVVVYRANGISPAGRRLAAIRDNRGVHTLWTANPRVCVSTSVALTGFAAGGRCARRRQRATTPNMPLPTIKGLHAQWAT
ncbi:hypothetical protein KCP69_21675 [Salmonella enterica subsp. enterica]|nr:hypothetical protein KCP69_21675 [Salmonella enterica subsp. enterica]